MQKKLKAESFKLKAKTAGIQGIKVSLKLKAES